MKKLSLLILVSIAWSNITLAANTLDSAIPEISIQNPSPANPNTKFLAINSSEVKQAKADKEILVPVAMQRAEEICKGKGYNSLLDFDLRRGSKDESMSTIENGSESMVTDNFRWSYSSMAIEAGMFALTGGLANLLGRGRLLLPAMDLGSSYSLSYAQQKFDKIDLKGWVSYSHASFSKINCLNTPAHTTQEEIDRFRANYFCQQDKHFQKFCGKIESAEQFYCAQAAYNEQGISRSIEKSIDACKEVKNKNQLACVVAAINEKGVNRDLVQNIRACSEIKNEAQSECAVAAINEKGVNRYLSTNIGLCKKIAGPLQAKCAVAAINERGVNWDLGIIVSECNKLKNDNHLVCAIAGVNEPGAFWPLNYLSDHCTKVVSKESAACVVASTLERGITRKIADSVQQCNRLQNTDQLNCSLSAINQKGFTYESMAFIIDSCLKIKNRGELSCTMKNMEERGAHLSKAITYCRQAGESGANTTDTSKALEAK